MDDIGNPIRACIGAVAYEIDEAVEGSGVVGFDVIGGYKICQAFESCSDNEGENTVVTDSGKDCTLIAL